MAALQATPLLRALSLVLVTSVAAALFLRRPKKVRRRRVGSPLPGGALYLDYAATCPIYPDVADAMVPYLYEHWGNPSSGHAYGWPSKRAVEAARERVRLLVNAASADELVFCSCGSEADNWALVGALGLGLASGRRHVVVSSIEHPAIIACVEALEREGRCTATVVPCDGRGVVAPEAVAAAVRPGHTAVVSVMLANNEVGSIQDVASIAALVKEADPNILVHTDAAQAVGKVSVDVAKLKVDLLTLVGHKLGAPKGVAALYVKGGVALPSLFHGGGQERGRRAGTENVPYIVALGEAAQVWLDQGPAIAAHSARMRDELRGLIEARLGGDTRVNGPLGGADAARALPNVLSLSVRGARAADVLRDLGDRLAASASAACHSGSAADLSAVLQACGVDPHYGRGTLRLSVGRHTTLRDVRLAADLICDRILLGPPTPPP